ncbi:DUF4097 family beta strand repeat-containing protein [Microbacterium murale]|uniref:DUF4097 domain-containing protein n=1 Tax=Microbacterium murale TaxID=1081040 RepID=A0ABU0P8C2_9MICO|nr:DUF4097 family beta strand repeat-containing protein [Microbacterium murale]MDQ0643553.1 hypothetical protein [Microbacterium murale]
MNAESQNNQGRHDTPLSPPPAAPAEASSAPSSGNVAPGAATPSGSATRTSGPEAPRGSGARAAAITIAAFGGVALLATGGTAAVAAVNDVTTSVSSQQQADATGITGIDLDLGGAEVHVQFGDVEQAELEVSGTSSERWTLLRDDEELLVNSPDMNFGWWFGDWFEDEGTVVLTLPEDLLSERIDADISLGAGSLDVVGDFGDIDVEMGAGALFITGSADTIDADLSAGRAEFELDDVSTAAFSISAGRLEAELTGTAPTEVQVDVSAGSLLLTLPDDEYDVRQEVSAGSLDNGLQTSPNARNSIVASVSAGSAVLRPGD